LNFKVQPGLGTTLLLTADECLPTVKKSATTGRRKNYRPMGAIGPADASQLH
jgi:hypothetical protein